MRDAIELIDFLPISYRDPQERDYIVFLWDAYDTNYETGKYEFASLALHLLYMSFVSFSLWQIRHAREHDFKNALVGFQSDAESHLLSSTTPFKFFEKMKESQVFRFLKLIGCENSQVGEFSKFVKRRNRIAHPSGSIFFNDQVSIDNETSDMMREVFNIQGHMGPIILEIYEKFLLDSSEIEEREYSEGKQELEVNFLHKNYISKKDIESCLRFDTSKLANHPNIESIEELHRELLSQSAENQ